MLGINVNKSLKELTVENVSLTSLTYARILKHVLMHKNNHMEFI